MQIVVLTGGLADRADYHGLASFTAALLREGTTRRFQQRNCRTDRRARNDSGRNSGFSSLTSTVSTSGLVENIDQTLDIFADVVPIPRSRKSEVDKYKARTLSQITVPAIDPQFLAQEHSTKQSTETIPRLSLHSSGRFTQETFE